ncbi:MAG: hypothetical protein AB1589_32025 [Cyanobacteriota bacterium]
MSANSFRSFWNRVGIAHLIFRELGIVKRFGFVSQKQFLLPILVLAAGQKFYVAPSLPYPGLGSGNIEQYEAPLAESPPKRLRPNPEGESSHYQ